MKIKNRFKFILIIVSLLLSLTSLADEPPVKKSNKGICHPQGGTYYSRTIHYTPYPSMEACIKSGGRAPKR